MAFDVLIVNNCPEIDMKMENTFHQYRKCRPEKIEKHLAFNLIKDLYEEPKNTFLSSVKCNNDNRNLHFILLILYKKKQKLQHFLFQKNNKKLNIMEIN